MLSVLSSSAFGLRYVKPPVVGGLSAFYNYNFDAVAVGSNNQTSYIDTSVSNYGSSGWDLKS